LARDNFCDTKLGHVTFLCTYTSRVKTDGISVTCENYSNFGTCTPVDIQIRNILPYKGNHVFKKYIQIKNFLYKKKIYHMFHVILKLWTKNNSSQREKRRRERLSQKNLKKIFKKKKVLKRMVRHILRTFDFFFSVKKKGPSCGLSYSYSLRPHGPMDLFFSVKK
jgi:hypothetical protein